MSDRKLFKIGIIGYGGFGKFLHNAWKQLENIQITGIADPDLSKLKGLQGPASYTLWQALIEKDLDLVAISTLPDTHAHIAAACMDAGKNVLIEKPLATTVEEAGKVIQVRNTTGKVAGINFIMRFNPLVLELKDLTQQKTFGKLRRVVIENYAQDETLPPGHWFWEPDRSGGILVEHGVHFIDLVHFAPAKPVEICGLKHHRNPGQEDQVLANIVYEGGLIASHYHSFSRPGFFEATKIKLAFDLADLELFGWIPLRAEISALVNPKTKEALLSSPLFEMRECTPIGRITDESRPEGWGPSEVNGPSDGPVIRSAGVEYKVHERITGHLLTRKAKQELYTLCVQASLLDVLKKIENAEHRLTAPLEAGLDSLQVAVRAAESARSRK